MSIAQPLTNKALADKAYNNEQLNLNTLRLQTLLSFLRDATTELSKTGVTRQLLWYEYLQQYPDGYGYSQFCFYLKAYQKNSDLSMHMEYISGDMIMVDFAGKKRYYVDEQTGECIDSEVFIAILPYSGLIFCHAVHTVCTDSIMYHYSG